MHLKQRLIANLNTARGLSEKMLADFHKPEEWTFQLHPTSNHALWFVGHMGAIDNFAINLLAPEQAKAPPRYREWFGMGSQPTSDPSKYPPAEEVLAYMRERRQTLLAIADKLSDADLEKPMPKGAPAFVSDYASLLERLAWHEGIHSGQLSVVRRALGHSPVFTPPSDT